MSDKFRISFILPFKNFTGGTSVVFKHAQHLGKKGYDVVVYYPLVPYFALTFNPYGPCSFFHRIKTYLSHTFITIRSIFKSCPFQSPFYSIKPIPSVQRPFLRKSDCIVATSMPTSFSIAKLPSRFGKKFYFIQGYETWCSTEQKVHISYQLPAIKIAVSNWLIEIIKRWSGKNNLHFVPNGVDFNQFYPGSPKNWNVPTLLLMYHDSPFKGAPETLQFIEIVHRQMPTLVIKMFGHFKNPKLPCFVNYTFNPDIDELRKLYQEANIFICLSRTDGWGLTVSEAMACECAVITTKIGCVPELNRSDNLAICETNNPDSAYDKLKDLLDNKDHAKRCAYQNLQIIKSFSWENAHRKFEKILIAK